MQGGGGHLTLIGRPKEIVDVMEEWLNEGVADGFNLMPPTLPYSLEDFVEHVIPYNIVNYLEMHISRLHCVSCLALNL